MRDASRFRIVEPTGTAVSFRVQERGQVTGGREGQLGTWQTIGFCNNRKDACRIFNALAKCEEEDE